MKKRHIRIDNSKEVYDSESISYINSLSDLIEEFYNVSKNINNTKKSIIKILKEKLDTSKSTLDKILKEINSNKIDSFNNYLENIKDIFNMLNFQDISGEKNIFSFFEEAKILINKIKEKSQESILKNRINRKLLLNYKTSNSFNNSLKNRTFKQIIEKENNSLLNMKNKDVEDNILGAIYNYTSYSDINIQYFKQIYDEYSNKNQRNDYAFKNFESTPISLNNNNSVINQNKKIDKDVKILDLNIQIEKLNEMVINKEKENKKLLEKIEIMSNNIHKNDKKEELEKLEEKLKKQLSLNNDLKKGLSNLKNNYKSLKMENTKKISDIKNIKQDNDRLINEIKNLKNENAILKSNNEKIKIHLKQLISKIEKDRKNNDEEINILKKEKEIIKNRLIEYSKKMHEDYNDLEKQYKDLENKYIQIKNKVIYNTISEIKTIDYKNKNNNEEKSIKDLKEAKNEIEIISKENLKFVEKLEGKVIKDNYSEENNSNYEEEFDFRKMTKRANEKGIFEDINIDYPEFQIIKQKYIDIDYNYLQRSIKKMLLTSQTNSKNKKYVLELCKFVGFDLETTNKILTNKYKN